MAITNGYLTLSEAKSYLDIEDTDDDIHLEIAVEAASRAIDDFCNRRFYSATETRYYTACDSLELAVDDVVSVTTLKTDPGSDGTFEETWSASDYLLAPFNANTDGRPYTRILVADDGDYTFPVVTRGVEIAGSFGWPSVPTAVKQACGIQTNVFFRQVTQGAAPVVTMDGTTFGSSKFLDRTVELLLSPYRRMVVA